MTMHEEKIAVLVAECRTRRRKVLLLAGSIAAVVTVAAVTMMVISLNFVAPALIGWLIISTFVLKMGRSKWAEIGKFERIQKLRMEENSLTERRR